MKNIIITERNSNQFIGLDIVVIKPASFTYVTPFEWLNYDIEFKPYHISSHIESVIGKANIIYIDFEQPLLDKYLLAAHILSSTDAAICFFSETGNEEIRLESDYCIFKNKAINLYSKSRLDEIILDSDKTERLYEKFWLEFSYDQFRNLFQKTIDHDRHQAINEWAAIKLLFNHGKTLKEIEGSFKFPRTIFFKQNLKEFGISDTTRVNLSSSTFSAELTTQKAMLTRKSRFLRKILLIDDNADKGWVHVLNTFFPNSVIQVKKSFQEADVISDFSVYDFIFLDLKLPLNTIDTIPKIENGLTLIEKIKGSDLSIHVPLLVLTASQKASTMYAAQQKGADDVYVKEDPAFSIEQSTYSYLEFIKKINQQIKKAEDLKQYWVAIKLIKNSFLPQIVDANGQVLKSRIIERLEMFYGLLKKNHEQSSFNDSRFHFSAEILSFITLWSTLNEIQECYYQKGLGTSSTKIYDPSSTTTANRFIGLQLDDWKIKGQTPNRYFIVDKPIFEENISTNGVRQRPLATHKFKIESYSNIISSHTPPFFDADPGGYKRNNGVRQKLFLQIGFLLVNKNEFKSSSKIRDYKRFLKESNLERNKLYITHGETLSTTFHTSTEKNKTLTNVRIQNLFKLITFLLTGDDSII